MLGSAPPPPRHIGLRGWRLWGSGCAAPPPPLGKSCIRPWGGGNDKQKNWPIAYATFATRLIRATAMKSLTYLPRPNFLFKIRPYKLARRPLQGLRPGAMPPLPPPRYATGSYDHLFCPWPWKRSCFVTSYSWPTSATLSLTRFELKHWRGRIICWIRKQCCVSLGHLLSELYMIRWVLIYLI